MNYLKKSFEPHGRARPAVIAPSAMDPGLRLNKVNVKPPYLLDLEIESMKKFILEYMIYSQKCPRQLLSSMQRFELEEHLNILCSDDGIEIELMDRTQDEFITSVLRIKPTLVGNSALGSKMPKW